MVALSPAILPEALRDGDLSTEASKRCWPRANLLHVQPVISSILLISVAFSTCKCSRLTEQLGLEPQKGNSLYAF